MFSNSFPKERKPAKTLQEDKQSLAGWNPESEDNELIKYFLPENNAKQFSLYKSVFSYNLFQK